MGEKTHNVSSQLVTENIYIWNVQVMMSNVISSAFSKKKKKSH